MTVFAYLLALTILIGTLLLYSVIWGSQRVQLVLTGLIFAIAVGLTVAAIPGQPKREVVANLCESAVNRAFDRTSGKLGIMLKPSLPKPTVEKPQDLICRLFNRGCE